MSVEDMKVALAAMSNGQTETNEDSPMKAKVEVYKDPEGRAPGTLDARWGAKPPSPVTYGSSTEAAAREGRTEMIERLFDTPKTYAQPEQALMSRLLEHASQGAPHSPMLQRGHKIKEASVNVRDETLTDQVMRVAGRR